MAVAENMDPVVMQVFPTYIAILRSAPHPNAAKLMISWLMGSPDAIGKKLEKPYKEGESARLLQGREPWFSPGGWAPMNDYPVPQGAMALEGKEVWMHDQKFLWGNALKIQDFWMQHGG